MKAEASPSTYGPKIVPELQRIQHLFGYLKRESLEEAAIQLDVPLHRLQAVASFFPHFRLSPPKRCVVRVCRDLSCHMAGASTILRELESLAGDEVEIVGASCLGRCDRAPAALVDTAGSEHSHYYLRRSSEELKQITLAHLRGDAPRADVDSDLPYRAENFVLNPYGARPSDYAALTRVIAARDASLTEAAGLLGATPDWNEGLLKQFRVAAACRVVQDGDAKVSEAVRLWATDDAWAKGPTLGGWSEGILREMEDAKLRGLGGAGIPSTQKLRDVRDAVRKARKRHMDDRAFIVVNGDESEPGTFKDREILLRMPHLVVEGVLIAALLTEATQGFIYIRHEYVEQVAACWAEIRRAEEMGFCGDNAFALGRPFPLSVFASPGGYICGEQSALIEALSDRRGEPRNMPPSLETNGLENLPTIVSNVETYSWMPYICINTGKKYASLGVNGWSGRRLFSISGDVKRPGVYEVPMGLTLRELVHGEGYCQGIAGDKKLKGFAPSGPSGGFLPAKLTARAGLPRNHLENPAWKALAQRRGFDPAATELDILDLELELDLFRSISPTQALGAGLVVYAEGRDMVEQAVNSLEFYRNESCGKCVPCRIGSQKFAALGAHLLRGNLDRARWDKEILPVVAEMGEALNWGSICALGRSVPGPLRSVVNYFQQDLTPYLDRRLEPAVASGGNGA